MIDLTERDVATAIRCSRLYGMWDFMRPQGGHGRHVLYGQEIPNELWDKAFAMAMRGFPKSEKEREERMARYIKWRSGKRDYLHRRKLQWILKWTLFALVAPPAILSIVAILYRGAVLAVLS